MFVLNLVTWFLARYLLPRNACRTGQKLPCLELTVSGGSPSATSYNLATAYRSRESFSFIWGVLNDKALRCVPEGFVCIESGAVLSCQDLVVQVLLPQWVLTSVFGMGTGGSPTP